jgi:hypothetical protein
MEKMYWVIKKYHKNALVIINIHKTKTLGNNDNSYKIIIFKNILKINILILEMLQKNC